jgi:hypothetical protein
LEEIVFGRRERRGRIVTLELSRQEFAFLPKKIWKPQLSGIVSPPDRTVTDV